LRLDWDRVLAAWALVFVLILGGSAAVQLTHPINRAEAGLTLREAKNPQRDPLNLWPPAFEDEDAAAATMDD
jgi:hypothetical protein